MNHKLSDYDRWFKPCVNCGHDNGKKSEKCEPRCWKCGKRLRRDFSKRALKKEIVEKIKSGEVVFS